jgi:putative hydrolase of the HAD superfamily
MNSAGTQLRCIVFDLDDTLYLERDYVRSGFRQVGNLVEEKFARPGFADVAWALFTEGHRGDIFDRTLAKLEIRPERGIIESLVDVYRNHRPAISLLADSCDCLISLQSRYKLALITDGPVASQTNKIHALGLDQIPIRILTGQWGPDFSKPHSRAFLRVQEEAGVKPNECMYIADNPSKDFHAPEELGWQTVRIRRHRGLYSGLSLHMPKPSHEFDNLTPIIRMLTDRQ